MKNKKILSSFDLRNTPLREEIITLFVNNQGIAFSEAEINNIFSKTLDRVTVYRTIRTFLDKLILHKIICDDGVLRYAITEQKAKPHHPHFQCTECGKVSCLAEKGIGNISLPAGYQTNELHLLVRGICANCSSGDKL